MLLIEGEVFESHKNNFMMAKYLLENRECLKVLKEMILFGFKLSWKFPEKDF